MIAISNNFKIISDETSYDYGSITNEIRLIHQKLSHIPGQVIGVYLDNSVEWVLLDLYAHLFKKTLVPIPGFFNRDQVDHLIDSSGINIIFSHNQALNKKLGFSSEHIIFDNFCGSVRKNNKQHDLSPFQKLTFTSGTTSSPKGVLLTADGQVEVAESLLKQLSSVNIKRHLSLIPFSILLENIGGIYSMAIQGGELIVLSNTKTGLSGSSQFDMGMCFASIEKFKPQSIILLPQMLKEFITFLRSNSKDISYIKFIAVGGSKIAPQLIHDAKELGLPVFEGYGLTECCSVVSVNIPSNEAIGSVGQPLPGREVRVNKNNEIEVKMKNSFRYLSDEKNSDAWFSTGDLGRIDQGYIYITGRKKNILITSYGRNVSPEWPEALLNDHKDINQSIILCDEESYLQALILLNKKSIRPDEAVTIIEQTNRKLPDYAQILKYLIIDEPTILNNKNLTLNGQLSRGWLIEQYREAKYHSIKEAVNV